MHGTTFEVLKATLMKFKFSGLLRHTDVSKYFTLKCLALKINAVGSLVNSVTTRTYHSGRYYPRRVFFNQNHIFEGRLLNKRTALFWAVTQLIVVIPYRRSGTTYRSLLEGSRNQRILEP